MIRPFRPNILVVIFTWLAVAAGPLSAAPHEVRLPLHDGKLHLPDLAAAVCREMHLPAFDVPGGNVDLAGVRGSNCLRSFNTALGDGFNLTADRDAVVLHVDPAKLPKGVDSVKKAIRIFTREIDPEAAAAQAAHWGMFLPNNVDSNRPLVLLIHGLDSEKEDMYPLGQLLIGAGYQVGYFAYPDDQPIDDSEKFLAGQMNDFRLKYPTAKIDIVAHSMGGLVARDYIEGADYQGGVDRLMLIGTPNAGSRWALGRFLLEINEQYHDWKNDPQWRWTWAITDGLGEAGRDLEPHSKFLEHLNSLPRRAGVRYTIIAGNQHAGNRISAEVADATVHAIPKRAAKWWGVKQIGHAITKCGDHFRHKKSNGDGPVTLKSAELAGVADVAIVPADHAMLICPDHGNPPGAWPVILDRLGR